MTSNIEYMIDLVFELGGETPPPSYPFALWEEILRLAPHLEAQNQVGVLPLRLPANSAGMMLQKRAKLVLRLPKETAERTAKCITGQQIEVDGCGLNLGVASMRAINAYPTIHAHMVAGASNEVLFMNDVSEQLAALGVSGNLICGKRDTLENGQQSIYGFSLVIHDLKPDASLKLQHNGLGDSRQYGCGIFIPYKLISGLSDD